MEEKKIIILNTLKLFPCGWGQECFLPFAFFYLMRTNSLKDVLGKTRNWGFQIKWALQLCQIAYGISLFIYLLFFGCKKHDIEIYGQELVKGNIGGQWLALPSPHSRNVPGSSLSWSLFMFFFPFLFCILSVHCGLSPCAPVFPSNLKHKAC